MCAAGGVKVRNVTRFRRRNLRRLDSEEALVEKDFLDCCSSRGCFDSCKLSFLSAYYVWLLSKYMLY